MSCSFCNSVRVASLSGKCSDMCYFSVAGKEKLGYAPCDAGVGGGDYIELKYCLDCGKIQGKFPLPPTELENPPDEDDE